MKIHLPQYISYMLQGLGQGILKGCGRQFLGSILNIIVYDVFALPIGLPLMTLTELGIAGNYSQHCLLPFPFIFTF